MQAVGPGWWDLLAEAFAEVEKAHGRVYDLTQKAGTLRIRARGPGGWLGELAARYEAASATVCEVCGGPATTNSGPTLRTHCPECAARWKALEFDDRALWMNVAGRWLPEWDAR